MRRKVWTVEEFERMTPAEQDAVFEASIAADLTDVPTEFLARVRDRVEHRIADVEAHEPR